MTDFLERWAAQDETNAKLVAQELLLAEVAEEIWAKLEQAGLNKTELAERMGASKGHVSQVLSGSRNMTLRTLSDICFALGKRAVVRVEDRHADGRWETLTGKKVALGKGSLRYRQVGNVYTPVGHWQTAA